MTPKEDDTSTKLFTALKNVLQKFNFNSYVDSSEIESKEINEEEITQKCKKIEEAIENEKNQVRLANLYFQLGLLHQSLKSAFDAMEKFEEAESLFEQLEQVQKKRIEFNGSILQYNMGLTAKMMHDLIQAIEHFKSSVSLYSDDDSIDYATLSLSEIGYCYFKLEKWLLSLDFYHSFFNRIMNDSKQKKINLELMVLACSHVGTCAFKLRQFSLAESFLNKSLDLSKGRFLKIDSKTKSVLSSISEESFNSDTDGDTLSKFGGSVGSSITNDLKDLELSDDDDSWADIDISPADTLKSKLFLADNIDTSTDEVSNFKLLPETEYNYVTITYPKPSTLFSIKTKEGHKLLSETDLYQWITTLVKKYRNEIIDTQPFLGKDGLILKYSESLKKNKVFSRDWCLSYATLCYRLFIEGEHEECWKQILCYITELQNYMSSHKNLKGKRLLLTLEIINMACKLWTDDRDSSLSQILNVFAQTSPTNEILSDIFLSETYGHYCMKRRQIIDALANAYEIGRKMTSFASKVDKMDCIHLQVRALVDIHLYLSDRSILTTEIQKDIEESNEDEDFDNQLCDEKYRMDLLEKLYLQIEPSFLKAKAAFVLGIYYLEIVEDLEVAEQLLFECLYMLDNLENPIRNTKPIVSDLGCSALRVYGDILVMSYKYKYAVGVYDAALSNLKIRNRMKEYYDLMRHVASIAYKHDDLQQSAALYTKIVEYYRNDKRINEAVYVYEILCGIHLEMGYFKLAVTCLQQAACLLPDYQRFIDDSTLKSTTLDPGFLKIQLQLVRVYLDSYNWDKGIDLLEQLAQYNHPVAFTLSIYELLARAFIKKRSYKDAEIYLEQWKALQVEQLKEGGSLSKSHISATKYKESYELLYYELKAKNCFHNNKYFNALDYVDKAILLCNYSRYQSLGKYYYLRGKILSRLSLASSTINFQRDNSEIKGAIESYRNFKTPGDVLQECIATLTQAYYYFKLTGDDERISKAVSTIAETYLEYIFWPSATGELSFEDISTLTYYEPSDIGQNIREKLIQSNSGSDTPRCIDETDNEKSLTSSCNSDVQIKVSPSRQTRHKRSKSALTEIKPPRIDKGFLGPPPPRDPKKKIRNSAKPTKKNSMVKESSSSSITQKDFVITLSTIESAAQLSLEISIDTTDILRTLNGYMNMAELRFLEGKKEVATRFWQECKDNLFLYYFDGPRVILNEASLPFLESIYHISKRAVRFMFFLSPNIINNNLDLIDVYLIIENDVEQQLKKAVGSQIISSVSTIESSLPRTLFSLKRQKKKKSATNVKEVKGEGFTLSSLSSSPTSTSEPSFISKITSSMKNSMSLGDEEKNQAARDNATLIWGQFYYMNKQRHKYSDGKITSEELKTRNTQCLKNLIKLISIARSQEPQFINEMNRRFSLLASRKSTKRFNFNLNNNNTVRRTERERSDSMQFKSPLKKGLSFYELVNTKNEKITRIMYIVQIDERVVYYSPMTGNKKIQKIGKEDSQEKYSPVPTVTIKIHLLDNNEQYITLSVPSSISLVQVLEYLIDKNNWNEDFGKSKKKKFFSSLIPGGKSESKIEKIEKSKEFFEELAKLISFISDERKEDESLKSSDEESESRVRKRSSVDPISLLSLAKRKKNNYSYNSAIIPLKSKMQKAIFECFSKKELESSQTKPISLYFYISANLSNSKAYNATIANTIHFSEDVADYISSLIKSDKDKDVSQMKPPSQIIFELQQIFAPLIEIIPHAEKPDIPLSLICSKYMNAFPWELIFPDEQVIRFFSLDDASHSRISTMNIQRKGSSKNVLYLGLIACYYSQGFRHVQQQEATRKSWIIKNVFNRLNLSEKNKVEYAGDNMPLFPFHSTLVRSPKRISHYKTKFKNIVFVDLWEHFLKPEDIIKLSLQHSNPVFILSYADLLEISTCLYYLNRERPSPTFLFIPENKIKSASLKLNKMQGTLKYDKVKSPYHLLMAAAKAIREDIEMPIVIVNPPTCN